MNTPDLMHRIHCALNKELIKRLVTKYFIQKGFQETFNRPIYPPSLQDLIMQIPQLSSKIEIQPHIIDLDPQTGMAKLGWNLFVLGTNRMYLGESTHANLSEIQASIAGPQNKVYKTNSATPQKILEFITEILGRSKDGDISDTPPNLTAMVPSYLGQTDQSGYFRRSQRPVF